MGNGNPPGKMAKSWGAPELDMDGCWENSRSKWNLVGGDWNHRILIDFPETVGNVIKSQLTFTPSFFRGVGIPTTKQDILTIINHIITSNFHHY